ncbi:MAG: capsular polysaccharide synthesis protein [Pseudomonadota bacterium]
MAGDLPRIIWCCWLQGRDTAPPLVQRCLESWEQHNPGWELRCLDAQSVQYYLDLDELPDLRKQTITAASLSDIIRVLLLHEYGGVWVDATLFCNRPLDDWLPANCRSGFFAFAAPAGDRPISSWFLAATHTSRLISSWAGLVHSYWQSRERADRYFWLHTSFGQLCEKDEVARTEWDETPKISAEGPHSLQFRGGMYNPDQDASDRVDWSAPVFKLTHRTDPDAYAPGCLLHRLLGLDSLEATHPANPPDPSPRDPAGPSTFASLKVSTENLGDHIQIIAAQRLAARHGLRHAFHVDRDDEIATSPRLDAEPGPVGILLNGWFKTNRAEWPPHPALLPLFLGFHIRLFQCPELVSEEAIAYYKRHEPIGCRDEYTRQLLQDHGVETLLSNCLSILLPKRFPDPEKQDTVFVVSRTDQLHQSLPETIGPYTAINHYSGSRDFEANMARAAELLETYRSRARLIITSLLHCALPAIAMGIPVIVFYPPNNERGHNSDRERFSTLNRMVRVYTLEEMDQVDWNGQVLDEIGRHKFRLCELFRESVRRWNRGGPSPIGPIAPSGELPPP